MHRGGLWLERLEDDREPAVFDLLDDLVVEQPGHADTEDRSLPRGVGGRDREPWLNGNDSCGRSEAPAWRWHRSVEGDTGEVQQTLRLLRDSVGLKQARAGAHHRPH